MWTPRGMTDDKSNTHQTSGLRFRFAQLSNSEFSIRFTIITVVQAHASLNKFSHGSNWSPFLELLAAVMSRQIDFPVSYENIVFARLYLSRRLLLFDSISSVVKDHEIIRILWETHNDATILEFYNLLINYHIYI